MTTDLQDAVTLANDAELATAISVTTTELEHESVWLNPACAERQTQQVLQL